MDPYRLEAFKEEISNVPNFCDEKCNICSGNKNDCIFALLLRIRGLEDIVEHTKEQVREKNRIIDRILKEGTKGKNKKKGRCYKRLKKFTPEEILPHIGNRERLLVTKDISVRTYSVRLRTFKNNLTCVSCGVKGTHFWCETTQGNRGYHLNLYGTKKDGSEVLMTRDHIIPRSKGGGEGLNNMQTMCTVCNSAKGNTIPEDLQ